MKKRILSLLLTASMVMSVSYTHLDVYKRQCLNSTTLGYDRCVELIERTL